MKLRNKKTGEIIEFDAILPVKDVAGDSVAHLEYGSLTELNAEWEDALEEPEEYWYINASGDVNSICEDYENPEDTKVCIEIGNYFSSREEAEKAVEKLKALKRLKDKGMRTYSFKREKRGIDLDFYTLTIIAPRDKDSLDLLFGGEE